LWSFLCSYACLVCFYRMIWGCMCVWGWIGAVSAIACGWTVVNSAIFAQASSSRLGESTRELPATRARLGDQSAFWATPCLAQARRSRLSEKSWKLHVAHLAWARNRGDPTLFISPEREIAKPSRPNVVGSPKREPVAWARQLLSPGRLLLAWARLRQRMVPVLFSLFVWWVKFVIYLITPLLQNPKHVNTYKWLLESYELKVGMLAWIIHGFCLLGWLRTCMRIGWMTKKRWELYEKHDYDGEIGVIPWVPWGDCMVGCSVYIKIRIQVRIASRNSKGSMSLK